MKNETMKGLVKTTTNVFGGAGAIFLLMLTCLGFLNLFLAARNSNIWPSEFRPTGDVAWNIGYDEEYGDYQFSLKHDADSRKAYSVGIVKEGDSPTYAQTEFDGDLYFDLYADFWVFAETTAGVTVFHVWREGEVVKLTVNGFSQKDFSIEENEKSVKKSTGLIVALRLNSQVTTYPL